MLLGEVVSDDLRAGVDGEKVRDQCKEDLGSILWTDYVVLGVEEGMEVVERSGWGEVNLQGNDEEIWGKSGELDVLTGSHVGDLSFVLSVLTVVARCS